MFQSLQAGEEAQQAVGFSRGADSGGEVGASQGLLHLFVPVYHNHYHYS